MIYVLIAAAVFLLDLTVKGLVDKKRELGEETPILQGRIILRKYYNEGIVFDRLQRWPRLVKLLCGVMMILLCGMWATALRRRDNRGLKLGLSLVIGGGASNLWDRLTKNHVVDYFSIRSRFPRIRRIIFNISDWFIFLGSICMLLFQRDTDGFPVKRGKESKRAKKEAKKEVP
ncbi:MAG: signal peptidase II [Lachnospiraceae bacterium]|nr:signal peptidase II [Lachnospiraceae bacterium]MCI9151264.1 signal peptidase II [Lachnospiraceae bacterium]